MKKENNSISLKNSKAMIMMISWTIMIQIKAKLSQRPLTRYSKRLNFNKKHSSSKWLKRMNKLIKSKEI